ncbi:uncharacterized protein LOC142764759 [Rhipicephalus microplus]|uniref:uncharacterized protein LOC142764759 n=1 Tax=Rhipicephalus microplus TaxID=6941 RepID=UPI003F6B422C
MYAVAKALDILQGEQYMYMGVLQPTLQSLLRYQRSLPPPKYCTPHASSLQDAVKKRFSGVLEDADLALAAAVHPKFFWMTETRKAGTLRLLEEECHALEAIFNENAATSEGTDEDDVFFQLPHSSLSCSEVQQWLSDPGSDISELAKYPKTKKIFIQRNTGISSSTPAERLFSKGRHILSIKRGKFSDENFEKQLILKCNEFCK